MGAPRLVLPLALLVSACVTAPGPEADESAVMAVADGPVEGVNAFDADAIADLFSADATLFHPIGAPPRYAGIEEIRKSWHDRFDAGRAAGQTQNVVPRRSVVQLFGDIAILTFELGDLPIDPAAPGRLGRRTVVTHRTAEGWKIVHLHGSNILVNQPPAQ